MISENWLAWPLIGLCMYAVTEKYRTLSSKKLWNRVATLILFALVWPVLLASGVSIAFIDGMVESGAERKAAWTWLLNVVAAAIGLGILFYFYGSRTVLIFLAIALVFLASWSWADSLRDVG